AWYWVVVTSRCRPDETCEDSGRRADNGSSGLDVVVVAAQRVDVGAAGLAAVGVGDVVVEFEVAVDLASLDDTGGLLGADGGGERGGDAAAEGHDAGDVGALDHEGLDDRVRREPPCGAHRDGSGA